MGLVLLILYAAPSSNPKISIAPKRQRKFWGEGKLRPRSQSSSAISDVTSPVKPVKKIHRGWTRTRFQDFSGNSDSENWPGYEAGETQTKATSAGVRVDFPRSFRWRGRGGGGGGGSNTKIVYLRSTSCSERAISYFTVKTRVIVLIDNIIHGQVNGFFSSRLARYSLFNTITSAYE